MKTYYDSLFVKGNDLSAENRKGEKQLKITFVAKLIHEGLYLSK